MGKVIATFRNIDTAERAADELRRAGFSEKEISLVAKEHKDRHQGRMEGHNLTSGTTVGAGIGAGVGLLASAGLLAIPGIGPILAAGPLAATLSGAAMGGLTGAFVDWGIPKKESEHLQREVQEGKAVILVESPRADKAKDILDRHAEEVKMLA